MCPTVCRRWKARTTLPRSLTAKVPGFSVAIPMYFWEIWKAKGREGHASGLLLLPQQANPGGTWFFYRGFSRGSSMQGPVLWYKEAGLRHPLTRVKEQIAAVWPGFHQGSPSSTAVLVWSWRRSFITVDEAAASLVVYLLSIALGHSFLNLPPWEPYLQSSS